MNNLKAVPVRTYGCLAAVSDSILLQMRRELDQERLRVFAELRELAAQRNGLARVEEEIRLREL